MCVTRGTADCRSPRKSRVSTGLTPATRGGAPAKRGRSTVVLSRRSGYSSTLLVPTGFGTRSSPLVPKPVGGGANRVESVHE
jgi:hypothetical protein